MPSAGAIGSRALKVSERATPMSDHWPQLIAMAGRPDARRHATKASSHALAAGVRSLPGRTQQGRRRREPDPPVELSAGRGSVQPQGPGCLGRPDTVQALPAEGGNDLIVDHGCAVHDSPQGQPGLLGGLHESSGHFGCGDIPLHDGDLRAFFKLREDRPLLIGGLGSTVQRQRARRRCRPANGRRPDRYRRDRR